MLDLLVFQDLRSGTFCQVSATPGSATLAGPEHTNDQTRY